MKEFDICAYGAQADGETNCRKAIQQAIDACNEQGGGRVCIPAGRFLSGTLILKSNVELHLEAGAVLLSSLRQEDLIDIRQTTRDANSDIDWTGGCFLYAAHAENISITGTGEINGQGDQVFFEDGSDGGLEECPKGIRVQKRPRTTLFEDVEGLVIRDVTFRDAAFWTLHMAGCRYVLVDGIRIKNDVRGANNDGIDPDSCQNVQIVNCIVESGDDAIVVKNSIPMAAKYGACENIQIHGCILNSHDSGVKIGTETAIAIRHVSISDCVIRDCSRGIGIWARDGAVIEDIQVHHLSGNTLRYADRICRNPVTGWWGKGEPIFINATARKQGQTREIGRISHISFDHITMTSESCVFIAGEKESVISHVQIHDLDLQQVHQGTQEADVFDEQPSVRHIYRHTIPAVYLRHAEDVSISGTVGREESYRQQAEELTCMENAERAKVDLQEWRIG